MPRTSSCVSVMNCEVLGLSGSITCGWTTETPSTLRIASMAAAGSSPPAVKPAPIPMPRPATEIWPSTKRSPPSMKRTMRSAMAPSATMPATPTPMPAIVKRNRRRTRQSPLLRLARLTLPFQSRFHGEAGAAAQPAVEAGDGIEDPQGDTYAQRRRHPVAAGEHVEHGLVDAEVVARVHEEIEERRLVVLLDELEERLEAGAHAPLVGGERDQPEPAVAEDVDPDVALEKPRLPRGALEVREEGDLAEIGDPAALAVAGGHERVAARRVHQHRRPHGRRSALAAGGDRHTIGVEGRRLHRRGLVHGDAALLGVLEQDGVELGARHLVGVVRPRLARQEVERLRAAVFLVVEAGAVLQLEAALLDRRPGAELLEQQHAGGHQRLADVEAREPLALEQRHTQPLSGEERRGARAARAAPDHDDVEALHHDLVNSVCRSE